MTTPDLPPLPLPDLGDGAGFERSDAQVMAYALAAYRAGAEQMRESAARLPELAYAANKDEQRRLHTLAKQIRALEVRFVDAA